MSQLVRVEKNDSIGILTMNRPDKLNALSRELVADMLQALEELDKDKDIRVILLKGEGKSFSAGGDLNSMESIDHAHDAVEWVDYISSLTQKILELNTYVVAVVQGFAAGAGMSLALACDFIVMEKEAKFALSFTNVGLIPDLGLIRFLTERVPPAILKEWISSGKVILAEEAKQFGLINRIAAESLEDETNEFIQFILEGPPIANKYVKYLANHMSDMPLDESFRKENVIQAMLLQTEDHKEGVQAFKEKRKPKFKGK